MRELVRDIGSYKFFAGGMCGRDGAARTSRDLDQRLLTRLGEHSENNDLLIAQGHSGAQSGIQVVYGKAVRPGGTSGIALVDCLGTGALRRGVAGIGGDCVDQPRAER